MTGDDVSAVVAAVIAAAALRADDHYPILTAASPSVIAKLLPRRTPVPSLLSACCWLRNISNRTCSFAMPSISFFSRQFSRSLDISALWTCEPFPERQDLLVQFPGHSAVSDGEVVDNILNAPTAHLNFAVSTSQRSGQEDIGIVMCHR